MFDFLKEVRGKKMNMDKMKGDYLEYYKSNRLDQVESFAKFWTDKKYNDKYMNYVAEVFRYIASNTICENNTDIEKANKFLSLWKKYDSVSYEKHGKDLKIDMKNIREYYLKYYEANQLNLIEELAKCWIDNHRNYVVEMFKYIASNTVCMSDKDTERANKFLKVWCKFDVASCEKYKKDLKNRVDKILGGIKFSYIRKYSKNCTNYISKSGDFPAVGDCTSTIDKYSNINSIEAPNRYVLSEDDRADSILLLAISYLIVPACNMAKAIKLNMKCGEQFDKTLKEIESKIGVGISGKKNGAEDIFQQLHDKKFTLKEVVKIINDVFLIFKNFKIDSKIKGIKVDIKEEKKKCLSYYSEGKLDLINSVVNDIDRKYAVEMFEYIASNVVCRTRGDLEKANKFINLWRSLDKLSLNAYQLKVRKNCFNISKKLNISYVEKYLSNCYSYINHIEKLKEGSNLENINTARMYINDVKNNYLPNIINDLCVNEHSILSENDFLAEKKMSIRVIINFLLTIARELYSYTKEEKVKYEKLESEVGNAFGMIAVGSFDKDEERGEMIRSLEKLTLRDVINKSNKAFSLFKSFKFSK